MTEPSDPVLERLERIDANQQVMTETMQNMFRVLNETRAELACRNGVPMSIRS